eukprot:INCI3602.7.p1 GENE.INCI3602.7~~INCI3602.7.p1  ORF type:complete len:541 (-),score=91.38 INCI3602.7:967-2589(-)
MVATVSFFDEQQERRKVEPHLQAFKEEGGEVGPNAVGSFSVDSGEGTFAVNRLGSTQALSAIVDAVMQIWKLRDEDSAGLTGVGASPLDHAPATTEAHSGAKAETTSTNSDAIPAVHISNSLLALREHLSPSDFGWAFNDSDRERFDALTQELEATASEKLLLVHAASLARRHEFSLVHLDSTIAAVQRYLVVSGAPTGTGARGSNDTDGSLHGVPGLLRRLERRRMHWAWLLSFARQALGGMCELDRSVLENCLREHESWRNIQCEDQKRSVDPLLKVGSSFVEDMIERIRMVLWVVDAVGLAEVRRDWLVARRGLQLLFAFQLHALSAARHIFRRSDTLDEQALTRLATFVASSSHTDAQSSDNQPCQTAFSDFHAFLKNYSKPANGADEEAEGLVMKRLVATLHRRLQICAATKTNETAQSTTPSLRPEWDSHRQEVEALGVELEAAMRNEIPPVGAPIHVDGAHSEDLQATPNPEQTSGGATSNNEAFEKFLSAVTQISESGDDGTFAAMSASGAEGVEDDNEGCVVGTYCLFAHV